MKIEKQVCLLEQSKKLHELGIEKHKSIFSYWPNPKVQKDGSVLHDGTYDILLSSHGRTYAKNIKLSAFTVAELGMIVGSLIKTKDISVPDEVTERYAENEDDCAALFNPNLLADAIIHWLENKEITVEEINQRLTAE